MTPASSAADVWEVLETVLDPEVPALSVVDLGIVRDVALDGDTVVVTVTPTYSGCPATKVIENDILAALRGAGFEDPRVRLTYSPAWTTDWISEVGKRKLKAYGIAPPGPAGALADEPLVPLARRSRPVVPCPYCDSRRTEQRSEFGATACKAIHYCNDCRQPFELFKPL